MVMGNLSIIDDNPMSRESLTKSTIAHIHTTSTTNLTHGHRIAVGYAKLADKIEEHKNAKLTKSWLGKHKTPRE